MIYAAVIIIGFVLFLLWGEYQNIRTTIFNLETDLINTKIKFENFEQKLNRLQTESYVHVMRLFSKYLHHDNPLKSESLILDKFTHIIEVLEYIAEAYKQKEENENE